MKKYLIAPKLTMKNGEIFQNFSLNLNSMLKKNKIDFDYYCYGKKINAQIYDGLILCGGGDIYKIKINKINKIRDKQEKNLIKEFLKKKKKILAICRGFQLISDIYGAKIIKIKNHVKKNNTIKILKKNIINAKKINVTCYHNYAINKLSSKFIIIGKTKDKSIEIALNEKDKILGLMFHPERKNISDGLISKFLKGFF